uniref:Disease resistance R13L4/SHOC-2-like LRR domain-containing protein n=1 Tax=Aegilops tauschii TaxID=37682 RepID=M8BTS0_AEGTA
MYDMGNCDVNEDKEEEEIEEDKEEFLSSICELGKAGLESLHIFVKEAADEYFKRSWFPDPHCGLHELIVVGDSLSKVPASVASLVNLEKLCITMGVINERDMEILRGLPSLCHLRGLSRGLLWRKQWRNILIIPPWFGMTISSGVFGHLSGVNKR